MKIIASKIALFLLATGLPACAHSARQTIYLEPGQPVDLAKVDLHKQSLIIRLAAGEIVPLDISIDGEFVASDPGASIPLKVKRSCLVRVDDRGLRISADGKSFDAKPRKPGSFQFGLGVSEGTKRATMRIVTPAHGS
jgi:hypothetical protein